MISIESLLQNSEKMETDNLLDIHDELPITIYSNSMDTTLYKKLRFTYKNYNRDDTISITCNSIQFDNHIILVYTDEGIITIYAQDLSNPDFGTIKIDRHLDSQCVEIICTRHYD